MHTYTGDDVFDDVFLSVALQIATLYNLLSFGGVTRHWQSGGMTCISCPHMTRQ